MRIYEVTIKRSNNTLVLPISKTIGTALDRIQSLLANVAQPGDNILIELVDTEEK